MNWAGHRKRVKHFHRPGDLHELTFSCNQRRPLLTNDDWRRRLSRHIDSANKEFFFELVAFVYMPEHVHLLVYPTLLKPDFHGYLAQVKQPFSSEIRQLLEKRNSHLLRVLNTRIRPGKFRFRFWQEGPGYDRNIYSLKAIQAAIDYIHHNPVRRGLCKRAIDWKWSSARWYLGEPPHQQHPDLPFIHGLPVGALD